MRKKKVSNKRFIYQGQEILPVKKFKNFRNKLYFICKVKNDPKVFLVFSEKKLSQVKTLHP